ncbi:hypothetical protein CAPTEDRAFT_93634, partial [Capitella teleta]
HWLPVEKRIQFKVFATSTRNQHSESAPEYLKEFCEPYHPLRPLRSSDDAFMLKTHP